jgi:hypothetical protein
MLVMGQNETKPSQNLLRQKTQKKRVLTHVFEILCGKTSMIIGDYGLKK